MEKIFILHAKTDIKNIHPCNGWIQTADKDKVSGHFFL